MAYVLKSFKIQSKENFVEYNRGDSVKDSDLGKDKDFYYNNGYVTQDKNKLNTKTEVSFQNVMGIDEYNNLDETTVKEAEKASKIEVVEPKKRVDPRVAEANKKDEAKKEEKVKPEPKKK